jgi:hypothetical protein
MRKRSREEEAERQRRRRSKGRSNRRTLKNIYVDDEEALRKALADEGIHVTLCLEYAVMEKLRRICDEHKRAGAKKAWEELADKPTAANGLLQRLESSDEPPQAPHKPRKHYTDFVSSEQFYEHWRKLSPERREQHWAAMRGQEWENEVSPHSLQTPEPEPGDQEWEEMLESLEENESPTPLMPGLQRTPSWEWSETGERRHVKPLPGLSSIEGVHSPVPPEHDK